MKKEEEEKSTEYEQTEVFRTLNVLFYWLLLIMIYPYALSKWRAREQRSVCKIENCAIYRMYEIYGRLAILRSLVQLNDSLQREKKRESQRKNKLTRRA